MAEAGYTPLDQLNTLRKLGSIYQGHPDVRFIPELEASTGSLGEGLSLALGMGIAARLDGRSYRTYVMLGDGEIQEGQIWEAAMSGAFHKVDNVVAIVDYNGIQLDGFVKDIMESRRCEVARLRLARGGNRRAISLRPQALENRGDQASHRHRRPHRQGKGVSFMKTTPVPRHAPAAPSELAIRRSHNSDRDEIRTQVRTTRKRSAVVVELARENKDIVVCDADLSSRHDHPLRKIPARFFSCGIAESNMVAVGAGLAYAGRSRSSPASPPSW
jgi:transketolase